MQPTFMQTVHIDPAKTYSLHFLVKNGLFGKIRTFSTARKYVLEDLVSEKPILKAALNGKGLRRSIEIQGKNVISYFKEHEELTDPVDSDD